MWVTNGYHTPRCLPLNALNSLKLSPSTAHDAGASPVGRSSSIFAAGSTPPPGVVSTPTSVAAASAAIAQVAGWDLRGDKRDSERTREEVWWNCWGRAVRFWSYNSKGDVGWMRCISSVCAWFEDWSFYSRINMVFLCVVTCGLFVWWRVRLVGMC